jgi:uncharacterized protein (DUF2342 family)
VAQRLAVAAALILWAIAIMAKSISATIWKQQRIERRYRRRRREKAGIEKAKAGVAGREVAAK